MVSSTENDVPIRDASTVILIRKKDNNNYVLMGQRGKNAVFMHCLPAKVGIEVIAYTSEDSEGLMWIYEIILLEEIDADEGDKISEMLFEEFDDIQFTFEASVEV